MGMILNRRAALLFAQKLAEGMTSARAYQAVQPTVTKESAAVMGSRYARNPMVREHLARLTERASEAGILGRQQIQELLSLAVVTPKNAESLAQPENAWLLTADSNAGGVRQLRGITALDALKELSKVSGYHTAQVVQVQHSGTVRTLADSEEYAEMLEHELLLAKALAGRATVETASIGQREEIDSEIWDLSWLDE